MMVPEWTTEEAQQRLRRRNWFAIYLVAFPILSFFTFVPGLTIALWFLVYPIAAIYVYRWNRARRTTRIVYDVDDLSLMERSALVGSCADQLAGCARLWHVGSSVDTSDRKHNAGASALLSRTVTRCRRGTLPRFQHNLPTWCLTAGTQRLLFLPDRLLAWDGVHLDDLPYQHLEAHARATSFVEDRTWGLPSDGRRVGSTWRYVNRDGGRDLRFKDNAELPVMEYGELELRSHSGFRVLLQTSTSTAAEGAAQALQALSYRVAQPLSAPVSPPRPPQQVAPAPPPMPAPLPPPPPMPALPAAPASARSIAILLRYLAAADRRIDATEHEQAARELTALAPSDPDLRKLISQFRELPADADSVHAAAREVTASPQRTAMVSAMERMVGSDGKATPKELERMRELRRWLNA